MANYYVYSGASGTGDGSSWTNAFVSLSAAGVAGTIVAGDFVWVAHDHNSALTSFTSWTIPGNALNPVYIICANRAGSVPPVSADLRTTAQEKTINNVGMVMSGYAYFYGITFSVGSGTNSSSFQFAGGTNNGAVFENCTITYGCTGTGGTTAFAGGNSTGPTSGIIKFINTNFVFASTGQKISTTHCQELYFQGGGITGSISPNNFMTGWGGQWNVVTFKDFDFSLMTSSAGSILPLQNSVRGRMYMERCKLDANTNITVTQNSNDIVVEAICCDSSSITRSERWTGAGKLTTDTVVVLSGGASDGVNSFSHKITTNANTSVYNTFESFPMSEFYAGATGSPISQTYELLTDNVTLTNKDAYIDLEYLGASGSPLGSIVSNKADILSAGANLTSSSVTWTTTGLTTPVKQKIVATFTPNKIGVYTATLKVSKPSTTLWLSPPANKAA